MDPTLRNQVVTQLREMANELTPSLKKCAKYIIDHPLDFGMDSIRDSARKSKTSTFTLVRLAQQLGFGAFEEMRAPFRAALLSSVDVGSVPHWVENLDDGDTVDRAIREATTNSLSIVQRSLERQSPEVFKAIVGQINQSRHVYISAVRGSYALAYFFYYVGRMAIPSLQLIPRHMGSALDDLRDAKEGDTLIAICFTPYSRETVEACIFAKRKGLKLVLISDFDSISDEFQPDYSLITSQNSTHHFGSYAGTLATIEVLLAGLVAAGGEEVTERIQSYENLRMEARAYWPKK